MTRYEIKLLKDLGSLESVSDKAKQIIDEEIGDIDIYKLVRGAKIAANYSKFLQLTVRKLKEREKKDSENPMINISHAGVFANTMPIFDSGVELDGNGISELLCLISRILYDSMVIADLALSEDEYTEIMSKFHIHNDYDISYDNSYIDNKLPIEYPMINGDKMQFMSMEEIERDYWAYGMCEKYDSVNAYMNAHNICEVNK